MKVTLQSTVEITLHRGVMCRLWEGETAAGIKCYALIPAIAHHNDDDARANEFHIELVEHEAASERSLECFGIPKRYLKPTSRRRSDRGSI